MLEHYFYYCYVCFRQEALCYGSLCSRQMQETGGFDGGIQVQSGER